MSSLPTLLRRPGAAPMVTAGMIGRLPMGTVGLGVTLLVVAQSGSYTLAGALAATTTLASALLGPIGSRLADRHGQSVAIPLLLTVHISALLGLVLAATRGWPEWMWFATAAVGGAAIPNLGAMVRTRWMRLARDADERSAAFALESVADELSFVIGPVIASALALSFFPAAPVLFGLAAAAVGGTLLALQRRTAPPPSASGRTPGGRLWKAPGMPTMVFVMFLLGGLFGALNVSTVAFAEDHNKALTGVLLGVFSLGSLVSGLILSNMRRRWQLIDQLRRGVLALSVALLPLSLLTTTAAFGAVGFASGLSVSVVMIGGFALVQRLVPGDRLTEALSLCSSGLSLGLAVAVSLSGRIIDLWGPQWSLRLVVLFAAAAAVVLWSRAGVLRELEGAADRRDEARENPRVEAGIA